MGARQRALPRAPYPLNGHDVNANTATVDIQISRVFCKFECS